MSAFQALLTMYVYRVFTEYSTCTGRWLKAKHFIKVVHLCSWTGRKTRTDGNKTMKNNIKGCVKKNNNLDSFRSFSLFASSSRQTPSTPSCIHPFRKSCLFLSLDLVWTVMMKGRRRQANLFSGKWRLRPAWRRQWWRAWRLRFDDARPHYRASTSESRGRLTRHHRPPHLCARICAP